MYERPEHCRVCEVPASDLYVVSVSTKEKYTSGSAVNQKLHNDLGLRHASEEKEQRRVYRRSDKIISRRVCELLG